MDKKEVEEIQEQLEKLLKPIDQDTNWYSSMGYDDGYNKGIKDACRLISKYRQRQRVKEYRERQKWSQKQKAG